MAYDWAGQNWYFLDTVQSLIFLCHHDHDPGDRDGELLCRDLISVGTTKPRDLALDPAEGDTYCVSHQWLCDKFGTTGVHFPRTATLKQIGLAVQQPN